MTSRQVSIWVDEQEVDMAEGEIITFAVIFQGAVVVSGPGATVYKNGEDVTSSVMPSGSHLVSGNVVTLKPINAIAGDGGQKYVVAIAATVDGNSEIRKVQVNIHDVSSEL